MVEVAVSGVTLGVEHPVVLSVLPVALVVVAWLVLRGRPNAPVDRRSRLVLFGLRAVVATCLVVAAAGPYTVTTQQSVVDPQVTMLVDDSESMVVGDVDADGLAAAIEAAGVPVRRTVVGTDNRSRIGDGIVANVEANGSVLLVSDGRATEGRSVESAAEFARSTNATVSAVELGTPTTERFVSIAGPPKASVGVESPFRVTVGGVGDGGPVEVTVVEDGVEILTETVQGTGSVNFTRTFRTTGVQRITARIDADDGIGANDVFYRTVRVVERPRILYVARTDYPFADLLSDLYDVTRAESVPADLDPYTAVVLQDVRADDVGDVDALRAFVVEGNGLMVVGGENAYENGDYAASPLASLLPVQPGQAGSSGATIVITVDVSGSTEEGMAVQKALALDVLDQLGPEDRVAVVAFDTRAYLVVPPQQLGPNRALFEDRIRRLVSGGGTEIAAGLDGAGTVLGEEGGNVVLLTDGLDESPRALATAQRLGDQGVRVIVVGAGPRIDEGLLRNIAAVSGGTYLRASETSRLRVLFGDRAVPTGGPLAVVDPSHFITAGVETTASPPETNDVSVREGADFLVAAGSGAPAVSAWRYGLGRVVSVTSYGSDGTLDGLLGQPDSLLLSRSVNWAIGDPERKSTGLVALADTRVGVPTRAVYVGPSRPSDPAVRFTQVAPDRFEATVVPTEAGFGSVLGSEYAVNYPAELAGFGQSPVVDRAVVTTGGEVFDVDDAGAIAAFVRRQATVLREERRSRAWPFLAAAILVYLVDTALRRLQLLGPPQPTSV